MPEKKMTAYYDGKCNVCTVFAESVKDEHVDIKSVHDEIPDGETHESAMHDLIVKDKDGAIHRGADAVLLLYSRRNGWSWLNAVRNNAFLMIFARIVYRAFTKVRYIFGSRQ